MLKTLVTTVVVLSLCAGLTLAAEKKVILPKGAKPNAGSSYGILADGTLYAQRRAVSLAVPAPITYGTRPGGTTRRRTDMSGSR